METCTVCNTPYPSESLTGFDDELLCHNCLERETVICHDCGERIRIDNNAGTPDRDSSDEPLIPRTRYAVEIHTRKSD